jgi:hypothetical protein
VGSELWRAPRVGRNVTAAATSPEPTARGSPRRWFRGEPWDTWRRWLPPARLLWICLAVLGAYGSTVLLGMGVASLVALPVVAVVTDLLFQRVRFPSLRWPDAALATGFFVALLFPPTVPLFVAGVLTAIAVAVRHILRYRGRPLFNPAATGALLGTVVFGLGLAWWVALGSYGDYLMVALGVLVNLRSWRGWRLPATFFVAFALLSGLEHFLFGGVTSLRVLALSVIAPATLFFGLFMIPEPRTSPADPGAMPLYAGCVAVGASFLSVVVPTAGVLVALLSGNLLSLVLRRLPTASARKETAPAARGRVRRPTVRSTRAPSRWPVAYRVSAAVLVLILLGAAAGAAPPPSARAPVVVTTPPSSTPAPSPGPTAAACQKDNASIPSSTLRSLHSALGPSVILSYQPSTGVVVFYDPVNQVTVTETDIYEDFGYAEFNGDDYASSGCVP